MKCCIVCKQNLPATPDYFNRTKNADGFHSHCRMCRSAKRRANPDHLKQRYGICRADVDVMRNQQNGVCAVCGEAETKIKHGTLAVDHDHRTGRVRGLLCHRCNTTIGLFKDSPDRMRRAALYLEG